MAGSVRQRGERMQCAGVDKAALARDEGADRVAHRHLHLSLHQHEQLEVAVPVGGDAPGDVLVHVAVVRYQRKKRALVGQLFPVGVHSDKGCVLDHGSHLCNVAFVIVYAVCVQAASPVFLYNRSAFLEKDRRDR